MEYSILPLRNTVLFPNQIIPIYIGRKQSLELINDVNNAVCFLLGSESKWMTGHNLIIDGGYSVSWNMRI